MSTGKQPIRVTVSASNCGIPGMSINEGLDNKILSKLAQDATLYPRSTLPSIVTCTVVALACRKLLGPS